MSIQQEKFKEIANRIRQHLGENELIEPNEFAAKIDEVYSRGDTDGYIHGQVDGIEQGKQAQYDAFWDSFQGKGTRENYAYAFAFAFPKEILKPKYDIKPIGGASNGANYMFYSNESITDLRASAIGVNIDFSGAKTLGNMCANCYNLEYIGVVDASNTISGGTNSMFSNCYALKEIEKFIPAINENLYYTSTFSKCNALTSLPIEGIIKHNITLSDSPLNKASIISVINNLALASQMTNTSSKRTAAFKLSAVNKAFETSEGANDGSTSEEWLALASSNSRWTISAA